jgi:hypothetical protein
MNPGSPIFWRLFVFETYIQYPLFIRDRNWRAIASEDYFLAGSFWRAPRLPRVRCLAIS